MKLKPRDYIAIVTIAGLVIFKLTGHNGSLDATVAIIIGYYFGRRADDDTLQNK